MTDPVKAAVREVVPQLVSLLQNVPDAEATAVGTWTVGDVAAHLSHAFRFDIDALAGKPVPEAVVTTAGMADVNAKLLADDDVRDPVALADRILSLAKELDDVPTATSVEWLQGIQLPPSVVAAHLLEECLIHGYDIAKATGRTWEIRRDHAVLAIESGVLPLIAAMPSTAFVDQRRGASFRARIEISLRGGGRTLLVFDEGSLTFGTAGDIDAHLWADPAALMLVFIGREPLWKPVIAGKLIAAGRRPWKLAQMLTAISPP
jgi:uncharacterized protein (TIGR03083 family)